MVTRETLTARLASLGLDVAAVPALLRFQELLNERAIPAGFLGPREGERLLERHVLECAALAPVLVDDDPREGGSARIVDVGSGAGLPGLVLAAVLPGSQVTLLEAERKRARFLEEAASELDLRVRVWVGRAEEAARQRELRETFTAAVARALAKPAVALELTLPFVEPGGRAVLAVGPSVELDRATAAASLLAGSVPRMHVLEVAGVGPARYAMIVEKTGVIADRYPRRVGVPARRPIA